MRTVNKNKIIQKKNNTYIIKCIQLRKVECKKKLTTLRRMVMKKIYVNTAT